VTATPRELAHAAELCSALAELNNAALLARPYVASSRIAAETRGDAEMVLEHEARLERIDAAIADAGDLLSRVES
jgi:hypothetical protein